MIFINEFQGGSLAIKSKKKDLRSLMFVIIIRVDIKCTQFGH